jgi:hypothetical protein
MKQPVSLRAQDAKPPLVLGGLSTAGSSCVRWIPEVTKLASSRRYRKRPGPANSQGRAAIVKR